MLNPPSIPEGVPFSESMTKNNQRECVRMWTSRDIKHKACCTIVAVKCGDLGIGVTHSSITGSWLWGLCLRIGTQQGACKEESE